MKALPGTLLWLAGALMTGAACFMFVLDIWKNGHAVEAWVVGLAILYFITRSVGYVNELEQARIDAYSDGIQTGRNIENPAYVKRIR